MLIADIEYKSGLCLDVHLPDSKEFSTFVYFHGGGLENGNKTAAYSFAEYLNKRNVAVVGVDYSKYPNAKYPDFIEDAAEAVAWTFKNISKYGDCKDIYVGGSSAGGYLSMMLCFDNKYLSKCGLNPLDVKGYIHDAGQPTAHFNVLRERGIDSRRVIIDESAPLYYVGEAEEYSDMLFIVSDNDMQNRLEQIELTISTLKHFGHEDNISLKMMHGTHCHYNHAVDDDGESLFGKIIYSFIAK